MATPPVPTTANTNNKRKRGPGDQGAGRELKTPNTNGDHETNYVALLQGGLDGMAGADDSTRTAQAALAAPMGPPSYPEPNAFDGASGLASGFDDSNLSVTMGTSTAQALNDARASQGQGGNKPAVGTAEWHQQRKDNHKEGKMIL